jgi:NAD(P)-dependent dehydrogenase (short-subunit alcohol dehydrogenase family)
MKKHWTSDDMPDQTGKRVLVTGASDGLGLELCRIFAKKNAKIVMACRNPEKAESAKKKVLEESPGAAIDILRLELGDLDSVRACAESVLASYPRLDIIMCNAGVMAVPFGKTKDGFETQMGVNYYGHFAFIGRLMPLIGRSSGIRIVTTSSIAAALGKLVLDTPWTEANYKRYDAYGDSKLAMLVFAIRLNDLFAKNKIDAKALSAHPGVARSNLRIGRLPGETSIWQRFQLRFYELMAIPTRMGTYPLLYAATDPEAEGGSFIGLSGPGEINGYPKKTRGRDIVYDPELQDRLWKVSEKLTGVTYDL